MTRLHSLLAAPQPPAAHPRESRRAARMLEVGAALLLASGLGAGCGAEPSTEAPGGDHAGDGAPASAALTTAPQLRFGAAAAASLSAARRALLSTLSGESARAPELGYDIASKAVLSIALDWSAGRATARDNALEFVARYQALLDPNVAAAEYRVGSSGLPCDSVVVLDRFIAGLGVIGSRLTLHFDDAGRLVWVTNGVAPVPATIVTPDPTLLPGTTGLQKLMGKVPVQAARRIPVMVPMPDGSGVYKAELATWVDGRALGAVALGDVATSRPLDASGEGTGRTAGTPPRVLSGADTDVPSEVSYRSIGGARVSFLAGERNPLESAYRFLEEHATLFHTGSARCQYVPTGLDENPTLPGVFSARLAQRHGRLPVFGAELVIGLEGTDTVTSTMARARGDIQVAPTPGISAATAVSKVDAGLSAGIAVAPAWKGAIDEALATPAKTRLGVMPRFLDHDAQWKRDRLVWQVTRGSFSALVDAQSAQVLHATSGRHQATVVKDARGAGVLGYLGYSVAEIDGIPQPGAPVPPATEVSPGLPGGRMSTAMGNLAALARRNGFAGLGRTGGDFMASARVVFETGGCPNAFFDSYLTSNAFICPGMASADVVGHELTHGIIARSSGLTYADQSGAINEAYADLFGNLVDGTPGWGVAEATIRPLRDMMTPGAFGQPAHMSAYVVRAPSCGPWPWDCDNGGVHTNSGIINRAHATLSDGLPGFVTGIGRERLERLAFFTMTSRLPSNATMNQVARATRDVCDMFVAGRVTTFPSGLSFSSAHCDDVTNAFLQVGLSPSLESGWAEPVLGFEGTDTYHLSATGIPDLTPGLCPVSNILLEHRIPVLGTTLYGDYSPTTALGSATSILDFVERVGFDFSSVASTPAGPLPLGTPSMAHRVRWSSVYGHRPTYNTTVQYPATCTPPPVQERTSATRTAGFDVGTWWGSETDTLGVVRPAALDARCLLTGSALELLDGDGVTRIAGPSVNPSHTVTHWILFIPATFTARASMLTAPTAANLTATAALSWDLGRTVRTRIRYNFSAPSGVDCNPR